MDEVREEEFAQLGKTRINDILLANTMPLTEAKTDVTEEVSTHVGNKKVEDTLLANTMPLSEGENNGIELVKESNDEADMEECQQTHDVQTTPTRHDPAPTSSRDTNATNEPPQIKILSQRTPSKGLQAV